MVTKSPSVCCTRILTFTFTHGLMDPLLICSTCISMSSIQFLKSGQIWLAGQIHLAPTDMDKSTTQQQLRIKPAGYPSPISRHILPLPRESTVPPHKFSTFKRCLQCHGPPSPNSSSYPFSALPSLGHSPPTSLLCTEPTTQHGKLSC